jgi:hypothetical protein
MRLLISTIICLVVLYVIDAYFFGGQYFGELQRLGGNLANSF